MRLYYLVETAALTTPEDPADIPKGNGVPFDATGMVDCAATPDAPMRQCPRGLVREGPGNAGV